jgi:hypothetical protein
MRSATCVRFGIWSRIDIKRSPAVVKSQQLLCATMSRSGSM